jgi:hypothetical protein
MKARWIFSLAVIGILMNLPSRACETRLYDDDVSKGCGDSQCVVQSCLDSPSFGGIQGDLFSVPTLPTPVIASWTPMIIKTLPSGWNGYFTGQQSTSAYEVAHLRLPGGTASDPPRHRSTGDGQ